MPQRRRSDAIRLKAGGGTGVGKHFTPFLKVRDVPSYGLSHRILGIKTGRIHHLLSNLEKSFFLLLDFSPFVTDIREQYPIPLKETLAICSRFQLRHPVAGKLRYPVVMTSDFLIDEIRDGVRRQLVRTLKPAEKLSERTLEKFEIERLYWTELGVDWGIIVDHDLPRDLCRNLEWLHSAYFPSPSQNFPEDVRLQVECLLFDMCQEQILTPFTTLTRKVDEQLHLPLGSALWITRHLLATGIWTTDLTVPLYLHRPLSIQRAHVLVETGSIAA